jgi:hypothetical protein
LTFVALAPDFELRNAARPGVPLPRAEFIERMQVRQAPAARIEQMAVHDLGETAVVSFVAHPGSESAPVFLVDVWSRTGGNWRLLVRYAGPGGAQAAQSELPVPDAPVDLPRK